MKICCQWMAAFLWITGSLVYAAETKEEKMSTDQTQQQYQRKSITYLGIVPMASIAPDHLAAMESQIRKLIELKRFDYNAINLGNVYTVDQFVKELREYVKKRSMDRAAAEAEYENRFKSARVYAQDIDRIMNSAYFYIINALLQQTNRAKCPDDKMKALAWGCVPNTEGMLSTVNASVTFYRANLMDENAPPYQLIREVKQDPFKDFVSFKEIPTDANAMMQLMNQTGLQATNNAAAKLAMFLSKEMKKIPDFQLLTPVVGVQSDGVHFMLGKEAGVGLDETYEVTEFDAAGKKKLIGYVKVRDIGDAKATGDGNPSYAEKVKEKRDFVGGELMVEHPMVGLSVGVSGAFEFALYDVLGKRNDSGDKKVGLYPGIAFYADYDVANLVKWPEFYVGIEGDFMFVDMDEASRTMLLHAMVGAKKKWYIESFILSLGLRGGISYFKVNNYEGKTIGGGGDVVFGMEYYFIPEISVYMKVAGRFFTNPLDNPLYDLDPELGAHGALGVIATF